MIEPGTLLQNRYRVAEQIGKGGMGEVYVATDERFQSTVAIKRTFYDDPEMRRAFEREARLLNRLRHGALPKVSDHFGEGGEQFLVMEFIEGSDLSDVLKQRKIPFPLADVLRWADELLDALDYLHTQEQPVVHRDIKPPNIKLTPRGKVVLLDFGLAKGLPSQTASGTAASSIFGYSLSFAPLEQMQGSGTDARSDLYSLAATLYYLLTCVRPADALTRASATVKQQPDPLRPAHLLQPHVSAAVGQILHRAMSQNPALRHASAAEMRAALRQAAHDAPHRDALPQAAAANVVPQSLPSLVDPTVLDEPSQHPAHRRPGTRPGTRPAGTALTNDLSQPFGVETAAPMDSRSWPHSSDTNTVSVRVQPRRAGSASKGTIGLVVCLVAVCLAAGAYLFSRSSGQVTQAAQAEGAAPNPESTPQQTAAEELSGSSAPSASDTSPDASRPNGSAQATQAVDNVASRPQTAPGASDASVPDARGAVAAPDGSGGNAGSEAGDRSGLVIQNPLPATTTTAEETRRAEESRPAQPAYRAEQTDRPPPYQGYPPPHERRPPPPGGHRPPPPRPPYR
jgi:serine/threonine protein kinase